MNRFQDVIRALRLEKDITIEKAAKALSTHKGYVSGWEHGTVMPPSIKFITRIAKFYGVSVLDLAELAWAEKAPQVVRPRVFERIAASKGKADANKLAFAEIKSVGASTVVMVEK